MFHQEQGISAAWAIGLIVAVPLVTVLLGEIIDRLRNRDSHYTGLFEILRGIVLPVVVVYIMADYLFNLDVMDVSHNDSGQRGTLFPLIQTVLYIAIAVAAFTFLRAMKFEQDPKAFENRIPGLFKALMTILVFAVPIMLTLNAWGILAGDFAKYASLALAATAFALQDALSSITKGFLLVLDKPFAVGDWIEVDGITGKVIDISWRSTRLQVKGKDIVVIPNLIISDNSVYNYTAEDISYRDDLTLNFSLDDPPNKVKQVMIDVLLDCKDVAKLPAPRVFTVSYNNFSVSYRLYFFVRVFVSAMDQERIRDDIMSRIWYAAERQGLTIPIPMQIEGKPVDFLPDDTSRHEGIFDFLKSNRYFSCLPKQTLQALAENVEVVPYSANETIFTEGEIADALGLIRSGEVSLTCSHGGAGAGEEIVHENELVSEIALMGRRSNPTTAIALKDTEVLKFDLEALAPIIEKSPRFAWMLNEVIESRMATLKGMAA